MSQKVTEDKGRSPHGGLGDTDVNKSGKRKSDDDTVISEVCDTPNKRLCGDYNVVLNDDQSYVDAVLTQGPVHVETVTPEPDVSLSQLLRPTPTPASETIQGTSCDSCDHKNQLQEMVGLISNLSKDIHKMFNEVHTKMDGMASEIENRLSKKFSQMIDKRMNAEMSKVQKVIEREVQEVKDEVREDIVSLQDQVDELSKLASVQDESPDLCVVIRNLPESRGENIENRVNGLVKDGLKLRNIRLADVSRKTEHRNGRHGVVIVKCRSRQDRDAMLERKKTLRQTREYKNVYLHPHQSREARLQAGNFKTLLSAIGTHVPGLRMQGARLVVDGDDRREGARGRAADVRNGTTTNSSQPRGGNRRRTEPERDQVGTIRRNGYGNRNGNNAWNR